MSFGRDGGSDSDDPTTVNDEAAMSTATKLEASHILVQHPRLLSESW